MPDTLEAPVTPAAPEPSHVDAAMERFNTILNAVPPETVRESSEPPAKAAEPAKLDAAKPPAAKATGADSEFPDEFLTGKKQAPPEQGDADIKKLLEAEPPAQLRSEAAKESFKTWKAEAAKVIEARNAKIADIEAKLAAQGKVAASPELTQQLKDRDAKLAEYEALIERSNFQLSPKFQKFVNAEKSALDGAREYLKDTEIQPGVIDMAAQLVGRARMKVLTDAGADAETIAAVAPYLAQVDAIRRDREEAIGTAKATAEQWAAEQKQQEAAQAERRTAEEDRVFSQTGAKVAQEFEPFMEVPGNEKWNAQRTALQDEAKQFFNGSLPLERVAEIAYYGVGAKVVHAMFHSLREKFVAAQAEITALKGAQPGAASLNGGTRAGQPEDLIDRAVQTFENSLGRQ